MFICGENSYAKTDVCIINDDEILLLIQEDKSYTNPDDPEPQIIAEAIAAFQENNRRRLNVLALPSLKLMKIPAITMRGTSPIFYQITIDEELSNHVSLGTYPTMPIIVHRHTPRVPGRRKSDGMKPLENRKKILQCFEAFKKFEDDLEKELEIPEYE